MDHGQKKIKIKNKHQKTQDSPQANFSRHCTEVNSVQFDDPYENLHHMEHTHEDTHLIDTQ